jgi:ABC-2 type transport system ATP-binding protein
LRVIWRFGEPAIEGTFACTIHLMHCVLRVQDAHKKYGSTKALDGAWIILDKGEWMALLGPNGAGKTTMIRAVAGRVRLDHGTVWLLGEQLGIAGGNVQSNGARSKLGVVPQDIALYPLLTARENMTLFARMHGVSGRLLQQRIDWAMKWSGLADRGKDLVKTFSGGMKRRLNIACGVLHQPDVVLLDEPTVGVDPQSRQRIWEMLSELRHAGASLLLTTHQLDEAQQICDRIVIIDHGRVIADGTLDALVSKTIGRTRQITLTFDRPLSHPGLLQTRGGSVSSDLGAISADGRSATYHIDDVARDLPPLLARMADAGVPVIDVHVQAPSLHNVFIHLTGRDLRE